jgi:hypothetical protein
LPIDEYKPPFKNSKVNLNLNLLSSKVRFYNYQLSEVTLMSLKRISDNRYLKIAFFIGGIYDVLLGIPLLFFPDFTATLLNVAKPEPIIWAQTIGIFLIIVGYLLLIAVQDVQRLVFVGIGSIVIRLGYVILVLLTWMTTGIETGYILIAITDTLTAIIILIPIILTEDVSWNQLWRLQP